MLARVRGFASLVFLLSSALPSVAAAQDTAQLKTQGWVSDFAGVLSPSARDQLAALCAEVDQKAHAQIAVVTVRSLGGRPIEDYSLDLASRWGVGGKKNDTGVMILVATDDHKYRFEVGYGLEGILPDGKVGGFGREAVPFLRENNYDAALLLMTERVAEVIARDRGVTLAKTPAISSSEGSHQEAPNAPVALIALIVILFLLFRFVRTLTFGPPRRRYRGSGGWIGPMMGGWGGGGFGGSGWGGGLGGGGGGGGFGGFGGGSFGGGGASGSW
ncbi:MAG TPA: TPM domain-containing protein [Candidatus Cybelea sp.]|nr:TPM domain-containing protein [Candidatus Cybelea sp.]